MPTSVIIFNVTRELKWKIICWDGVITRDSWCSLEKLSIRKSLPCRHKLRWKVHFLSERKIFSSLIKGWKVRMTRPKSPDECSRVMFTRNFIPQSFRLPFIMCVMLRLGSCIAIHQWKHRSGRRRRARERKGAKNRKSFLIRYHLSWENLAHTFVLFMHKHRENERENFRIWFEFKVS